MSVEVQCPNCQAIANRNNDRIHCDECGYSRTDTGNITIEGSLDMTENGTTVGGTSDDDKGSLVSNEWPSEVRKPREELTEIQEKAILGVVKYPRKNGNEIAAEIGDISEYSVYKTIDIYWPEKSHQIRTDRSINPVTCESCGTELASDGALTNHQSTGQCKVSGQKPYECEICGEKFDRSYLKASHMRDHSEGSSNGSDNETYYCPICGDEFDSKRARNGHKGVHFRLSASEIGELQQKDGIEIGSESFTEMSNNQQISDEKSGISQPVIELAVVIHFIIQLYGRFRDSDRGDWVETGIEETGGEP